jgi:DNA-binding NarL/FixJ family response regulator
MQLSDRHVQILVALAQGDTNATIGRRLGIALGTVKFHIKGLYADLNAHCAPQAVAFGYELGILKIGKTQGIAYHEPPALWNLD